MKLNNLWRRKDACDTLIYSLNHGALVTAYEPSCSKENNLKKFRAIVNGGSVFLVAYFVEEDIFVCSFKRKKNWQWRNARNSAGVYSGQILQSSYVVIERGEQGDDCSEMWWILEEYVRSGKFGCSRENVSRKRFETLVQDKLTLYTLEQGSEVIPSLRFEQQITTVPQPLQPVNFNLLNESNNDDCFFKHRDNFTHSLSYEESPQSSSGSTYQFHGGNPTSCHREPIPHLDGRPCMNLTVIDSENVSSMNSFDRSGDQDLNKVSQPLYVRETYKQIPNTKKGAKRRRDLNRDLFKDYEPIMSSKTKSFAEFLNEEF
eukprot:TRINITY_DN7178_c0_g1_i1.p1 TRINITY_DN7178_c0_g1~~TRINITY_DN7178_c0_g1_i1.p1  ORF type:complete len:326 (+),score=41.46 TRINITY_DN7178_c0_g1_i1:29-979(+)